MYITIDNLLLVTVVLGLLNSLLLYKQWIIR
jgi:hypothetical protein